MKLTLRKITGVRENLRSFGLLAAFLAASTGLQAQTPVVVGFPANFDAFNTTGAPVNGFEIEADGIQASEVTRVFGNWPGQGCVIRYCAGTVTPFPGGVYIRWASPWDPNTQQFTLSTPVTNGTVTTGESCWTLGLAARYPAAGCEHFGISTIRNPTNVVYRWLVPDPNNPGQLTYFTGNIAPLAGAPPPPPIPVPIPQPVINVIAAGGGAPAVAFEIQAPPPPPAAKPVPQYGDAQWVKVYKLESPNAVDLNDLMGGNPVVPEAPFVVPETEWKLLQYNPTSNGKSGILHNQALLGNGSHAVVRHYEHYKYTGAYDAASHQALCIDGTCSAPQAGELGDLVGQQNAAANIELPSINVTKVGSGSVSAAGTGVKINCGGTCFATAAAGTSVTLTAQAPSNGIFTGWGGACAGQPATCTVTVSGAMNVIANFATVYTMSVGHSSNGTITGTPNGDFSTVINCGSSCSAKFHQGATVTLTATPVAGANFTGWSGACSGLTPTCTLTIAGDTKVTASFK